MRPHEAQQEPEAHRASVVVARCASRGPVNASWLDHIEIWFSLLQRKILQPNHFTSLDKLEQAIQSFIAHYNQTAKPLKWSYTAEQLEHKLAPRLRGDVKSVGI